MSYRQPRGAASNDTGRGGNGARGGRGVRGGGGGGRGGVRRGGCHFDGDRREDSFAGGSGGGVRGGRGHFDGDHREDSSAGGSGGGSRGGRGYFDGDRREDSSAGGSGGGSRGGRGRGGAGGSRGAGARGSGGGGLYTDRGRTMRQNELDRLELEVDNGKLTSNDLLLTLLNIRTGFGNLINCEISSASQFSTVVMLSAKAVEEEFSPASKLELLSQLMHSKLFEDSLRRYITQLPILLSRSEQEWQTIGFLLQIFDTCFERMPQEAYNKLQGPILVLQDNLKRNSPVTCPSLVGDKLDELLDKLHLHRAKQLSMQISPEALAAAARAERFQQPPNDFRELSIIPTPEDLATDFKHVFLQVNRVKGSYPSAEVYLDTQFRLMREDMVEPLRRGLGELRKDPMGRRRIGDIRVYNDVQVLNIFYCSNDGISYSVQLDTSTPSFRRTNWSVSKRLIYGSLVCFSCDAFQTLYFATVQDRKSKRFEENGILQVVWVNQPDEELALSNRFVMIETTAFFESYKHVLETMKDMDPARVPFVRYLVDCQTQVRQPEYLRQNATVTYDFRPIMPDQTQHHDNLGRVRIQEDQNWPTAEAVRLDESQYAALMTALRHELAVIQGPPGTGKTHLGLRIAHMLVHNIQRRRPNFGPILLVCYTNHALDQFLEGILSFVKAEDAVRVGGRCKSDKLEGCLLYRKRHTDAAVYELRSRLNRIEDELRRMCVDLDLPWRRLLKLHLIYGLISPLHRDSISAHAPEQVQHSVLEAASWKHRRASELDELSEYFNLWILNIGSAAQPEAQLTLEESLAAEDDANELLEDAVFDEIYDIVSAIKRSGDIDDDNVRGEGEFELEIRDASHGFDDPHQPADRAERDHLMRERFERENAVDIDNCVLVDSDGFRMVFDRHRHRRHIEHQLGRRDTMTEAEAAVIEDVWSLDEEDRWRLYRYWRSLFLEQQREKISKLKNEYNRARGLLTEANYQCDRRVFENSCLVAMTTTGAARYRRVLRQIEPKIVIVEEAAEVLESHVLASLSPGCQHLVLIGDHKQLKPNPAVFELAKNYNLDVSMFERLVNNQVHYDTLAYQHRMRPQISKLMLHIYPGLQDHVSVHTYPDVLGMSSNLFFMEHQHQEDYVEEMRSRSNQFESEMVINLACHLVKQGYKQSQITVLTLYSGQLLSIKKLIPRFPLVRGVRVCVCDNYQGEENDIIILSMVRSNEDNDIGFLKAENRVCVALSRAKIGLYAVGNFPQLANKSRLWRKMIETVSNEPHCYGDAIRLSCQNHPEDNGLLIRQPSDFQKSPEGGCRRICNLQMPCGHTCRKACHPTDKEHTETVCKQPCAKKCPKGHPCQRLCHQPCKCTVLQRKTIPKCGHEQMVECHIPAEDFVCQNPCSFELDCGHRCGQKCGESHSYQCRVQVERRLPCQHMAKMDCCESTALYSNCAQPCGANLACGHKCQGRCGMCHQGRLHVPCRQACTRLLICGHVCSSRTCHQICPPCELDCINACSHTRCSKLCGEACVQCKEPCANRCIHGACKKKCHEPCDRQPCNERCSFSPSKGCRQCNGRLECIGLCGETHIIVCSKCEDGRYTGDIFFGTEDKPDAKFIRLLTCKHVFEVTGLDQWMKQPYLGNQIVRKCCPACRKPITRASCWRYGAILGVVEADIEQVRKQVIQQRLDLGTAMSGLPSTVKANRERMISAAEVLAASGVFANWMAHSLEKVQIRSFLTCGLGVSREKFSEAAQLQEHRRLQLLLQMLKLLNMINSTAWFKEVNVRPIRHSPASRDDDLDLNELPELRRRKPLMFANLCLSVDTVRFLRWFEAILPLSDYSAQEAEDELFRLKALAHFANLQHQIEGCKSIDETHRPAVDQALDKLAQLLASLTDGSRFSEARQKIATQIVGEVGELVKSVLLVAKLEREMIVKAMQLPSGHWFKCPRGHVYAIGDCGGANQVANCPECGCVIGGENHRLAAGNAHAPEMDGSQHPAWSDEANRMLGDMQLYD